jgi:hypothetical protein
MNPDIKINKDKVKIIAHIDGMNSGTNYIRLKRIGQFIKANLDGCKLALRQQNLKNQSIARNQKFIDTSLFAHTANNLPDLLSITNAYSQIKESNIAVLDGDLE